ncbi:hypothetical protein Tco_0122141 [Tanacetum coccineum]
MESRNYINQCCSQNWAHFSSKENMRCGELRIEQTFKIQDYALWDVIENGNSFKPTARTTANADGTSTSLIPGPVTTEEKAQNKNDVKARSMLLMALPNEHQFTFNQYKDAKTLFAAIQTRFGGNDATKKTQKTLLKQMYENFNAPSTESLDSIFNRLQKIVSQLAILGENISQEDLNLKFLRSLPSEWNTHVVVWRNKPDLDSMSFDDLYNNFKIVEQEVKRTGTSSSNSSSQNMAFVSTPSSTNDVNTANVQVSTTSSSVSTDSTQDSTASLSDATVYAFLANQPNGSQLVHEDLEQIHEDDLEEIDMKWQLALQSMRARKYYQRTRKKITINGIPRATLHARGPVRRGRSSGTTLSRLCAGPEEPEQAPPSPDYVLGPGHDDDEIVAEDQPYAEDASPIIQSPDYVPETDPEADPEEDGDKDPEEDPIDYPADGGDDRDDEMDIEEDEDDDMDIEADKEDEDNEMDVEIDEEAEEEHLAPAYPVVVVLPATAPSAEETKPFETDESAATPPPHPAYRITARITIPEPLSVPAWSDSEVARLLAISSPPASPLSSWSSSPPQIPFLLSPPSPVLTAPPPSPIRSLGYRAATIRIRAEDAATSHSLPLPPPFILSPTRPDAPPPRPTSAPTSFPPLSLPSDSQREGRPEVNLPPRMGLGLVLGPRYEVGESSAVVAARPARGFRADYGFVATMDRQIRRDPKRYVGYGITDSWDEIVETLQGAPVSTDTELGAHMREFESMVRRDTDEIYTRLDDEQGQRQLLAGRVNMLFEIERTQCTYTSGSYGDGLWMSREAWGRAMDASDLAHGGVISLRTTVHAQMSEITELQSADRRRQRAMDIQRETFPLGMVTQLQGAGDSLTGTGDDITGAGYCITGTAGTRWGSFTAGAARGGW